LHFDDQSGVDDAGKISEEWAADDMAAFAGQLGALRLPWAGCAQGRPSAAGRRGHADADADADGVCAADRNACRIYSDRLACPPASST
jgi:hypothetical protein